MAKKLGAVAAGVLLGLTIAFARAGAFPFWGSKQKDTSKSAPSVATQAPIGAASPAPANQPEPLPREGVITTFAPLVKRVMPTVVNVAVVQEVKVQGFGFPFGPGDQGDQGNQGNQGPGGPQTPFSGPLNPFEQFRHFFGQMPREFKERGLGSGVIVSPDGYILTNDHVVGQAEQIHVTLMDKREFTAKVIGKDKKTDLALIKIDTKQPLPAATLGDSDKAQVGDWVVAIGNPFGFTLTVTAGIVSAKGRALGGNYDDFIQTDASINPGNSGGPLFNTQGQVIGINTMIYSSTGTNAGIGFAIPIDLAKHVMEQLKAHGRVIRGWLGVEIQQVTPDLAQSFGLAKPTGALVAGVEPDGPAAKAALKRGDIIVKFDGRPVHDEHELPLIVADTPINKKVAVEVIRDGNRKTLEVVIGELKTSPTQVAKAEEPGSNWGMQVGRITPDIADHYHLQVHKGVVVRGVKPDSPAAEAGILPGDVLLEVNHHKVSSVDDFLAEVKQAKASKRPALILLQRGSATLYTVIKGAS
jgi:serine protease Do